MKHLTILPVALVVAGTCATALANCPEPYADQIFCDDFDTYCTTGGYPGDPKCSVGDPKGDAKLRDVWFRISENEYNHNLCGDEFTVEDDPQFLTSEPFGARYPNQGDSPRGFQTVRSNWTPGYERNDIVEFIQDLYGPECDAVIATPYKALTMQFLLNGQGEGKIYRTNGYMELALGSDRANTDYAMSPNCSDYCDPSIAQGPFQILCAHGNPWAPGAYGLCPPVNTAPVHAALAVGVLSLLDTNPCHCNDGMAHGGSTYHLSVYDGQLWWTLRHNNPMTSWGTVTPKKPEAPMPPPEDINSPGDFSLSGGENTSGKAMNWITFTVKATSFDVFLQTQQKSTNGYIYYVQNWMENIPRKYTGPFDSIHSGVGGGCPLQYTDSWDTCAPNPDHPYRRCIDPETTALAAHVFDDFVLYGGACESLEGACCLPNGSCDDSPGMTRYHCETELGGIYQGNGTKCDDPGLSCCPLPFADKDADGDVDQMDFGAFQVCYTGATAGVPPGCDCFDRDDDDMIDAGDYAEFVKCWTGANVPFNPGSPGLCSP